MKKISNTLLEFIFIIVVAIFIYSYNYQLIGNLILLAYFLYKAYTMRYFIYSIKGNKFYRQKNTEEAIKWFKKAAEVKSCRPRIIIGYAYLLLREGNVEASKEIIKKVFNTHLDPMDKVNADMTLALIQWKEGSLSTAIGTLEETYKNYKNCTLYESLGYLYVLSKDYEKALTFNLEAFDYDSNNEIILDNLGETYYFLGEKEKAIEIYEKLVERPITFGEPFFYYGLLLYDKGDKEEGLKMLNRALECKESFLSNLTKARIQEEIDNLTII